MSRVNEVLEMLEHPECLMGARSEGAWLIRDMRLTIRCLFFVVVIQFVIILALAGGCP